MYFIWVPTNAERTEVHGPSTSLQVLISQSISTSFLYHYFVLLWYSWQLATTSQMKSMHSVNKALCSGHFGNLKWLQIKVGWKMQETKLFDFGVGFVEKWILQSVFRHSRAVFLNRGASRNFRGGRALTCSTRQHGKFLIGNVSLSNMAFCNVAIHLHDIIFLQYSRRALNLMWCDDVYLWRFNCTWATLL